VAQRPFSRLIRLALAGLLVVPLAVTAAPPDESYLRGYVDALLEREFPGEGLRVRALIDGGVEIDSRACLGPRERRDIERLVRRLGQVQQVRFAPAADCATVPAPGEGAAATIDVNLLPERSLFAPLLADPREAHFLISYQRYRAPRQEFNAASVAFGEYFPIASGTAGRLGTSQIGIQGAVFALFNLDAPSSDLVNADYWIGVPLSARRGPWSIRARFYHQSSHLGDEFLLGNPGINRVNLSYEAVDAHLSYEWERVRVYGGLGYLVHSDPSDLKRAYAQAGAEYVQPGAAGRLDFIAAIDLRASAELDWKISRAIQAGLELRNASTRRTRLMLEAYAGHSPNGQFYRDRLSYYGVGIYFGF
jgi:hypothetical protein